MKRFAKTLSLLVLATPTLAFADGTISGRVEAMPAKFLADTVVYLKKVDAPRAPKALEMDQKGLTFLPHILLAVVGDTVTFQNHDSVFHNVFSKDNGGYNVGTFGPNQEGKHTFDKPGVWSQLCSIHPEMLAYVFVGQNQFEVIVDKSGKYTLKNVPPGTYELAVWNSKLTAADQHVTVTDGKTATANFSLKR